MAAYPGEFYPGTTYPGELTSTTITLGPVASVDTVYPFTIQYMHFVFHPPMRAAKSMSQDEFWGRLHYNTGITIVKKDGAYSPVEMPSHEELVAADIIYPGGRHYVISPAERNDLVNAGYGEFITTEPTVDTAWSD